MSPDLMMEIAKLQSAVTRWFTDETRQGFVATDVEFRIVVWNRWMEIHSGHAAEEIIGRSIFDVYPDAVDRGIKEYYENAVAGRVTVVSHGLHRYILPMPSTNAALGFAEMPQSGHIGPLLDGDTVIGTVTIFEDVSERLASESQLRTQVAAQQRARATAEKALRAKDDFLSTLSHELRNPLSSVLGWTRILLSRADLDRSLLDRGLHVIERNAAAQVKLIDDMLDMARIVAGKLSLEMQPVDLLNVVLAALDVVIPAANAKGVNIRTKLSPRTPRVKGDQDRLQQVIWNVLSNAVKFTESGGLVEVALEPVGSTARIVVKDTGQGITEEFLPHVFERFRQSDSSSGRRYGGLGLGLALVSDLVQMHGGTVTASSDGLDKGATFTIELPALTSEDTDDSQIHATTDEKSASLVGVRVLVVEDESDARDLAVIALEQCGAQVTAVPSSADGVSALMSASPHALPHVLVSDIGMPGETGYDFIRRVRSLHPERGGTIPAVTVTGYANPDDINRALAAGFQRHVAKPVNPSALVAAVADLVQSALPVKDEK
jgi:signal transduction histidine kinase/ActR/RegA family two-component response regulator